MLKDHLPVASWIAPIIGWLLLAASLVIVHPLFLILLAVALVGSVLAAVHHAEVVAHRVGEPFGTLVLALAVTVIEASLIVSLMIAAGDQAATLARDTIFAAIMIILNGMVGLVLLMGSSRHGEQTFGHYGVNAALAALATMAVLTLILPNATTSAAGQSYSASQLILIAITLLVLYGGFVLVQTVRHRDYFLPEGEAAGDDDAHAEPPTNTTAMISGLLLLVCLGAVVLLAKALSPVIEVTVDAAGAPKAVVGIIIAAIVLLPESLAALKAARLNRLQTSMNLALGSALATIGLTIPVVVMVALGSGMTIALGLDNKGMVLLALTLLVATLSLGTGRTTVLQGVVHLVIFAVYLFTTIVP
ncbi:MAG TPA: ionic transporter y4hA [Xanthobacteraceae bacterium]|nr:ionic transporter y4hA [Xanthobacteraceae bacterium]